MQAERRKPNYSTVLGNLSESLALFQLARDEHNIALTHLALSYVHCKRATLRIPGSFDRAVAFANQALRYGEVADLPIYRAYALRQLGAVQAYMGDTAAEATLRASLDLFDTHPQLQDPYEMALAQRTLGWFLCRTTDRPAEGRRLLNVARSTFRRLGALAERFKLPPDDSSDSVASA